MGLFIFKTYKEAAAFAKQKACDFSLVKMTRMAQEFKVELGGKITKVDPILVIQSHPKNVSNTHQPNVRPSIKLTTNPKRKYANKPIPKPLTTNEAMQLAYKRLANSRVSRVTKQSHTNKNESKTANKINIDPQKITPQKTKVKFDGDSRFCIECAAVIPKYRVNEFGAIRCIKCQTQFELNHDVRQKAYEGPAGSRNAHLRMRGGKGKK